jgi:hypothetical protein
MKKIFGLMFFLSLVTIGLQAQAQKPVVYRDTITVTDADKNDLLFANVEAWAHDNYLTVVYRTEAEKNGDLRNKESIMVQTFEYGLTIEFPTNGKVVCIFRDLRKQKDSALDYKPVLDDLIKAINS